MIKNRRRTHRFAALATMAGLLATGCSVTVEGPGDAGVPGDSLPSVTQLPVAAPTTTAPPTTLSPTTVPSTTLAPTTLPPTTVPPTTVPPVTPPPTTPPTTTAPPPPPPPPPPSTTVPPTVPPTTAPSEPPAEEPEPLSVAVRVALRGEGKIRVNGKRIAGTGDNIKIGTEHLDVDISEYLRPGSNTIQVDYVRIALFCDPTLDVVIFVNGSVEVDRSTRTGDCIFEWNWTIDGTTGVIRRERDSG
jgi:hypothetical protein